MANSKKTSTTRSSIGSTGKKTAGRASSSRKTGKKIGKKAISKTSVPRPQNAASSPDTQPPAADSSTSAAQPPASNSIPESAAEPATGPATAASISAVPGWLGLLLGLLACAALLLLAVSKGTDYFTTANADTQSSSEQPRLTELERQQAQQQQQLRTLETTVASFSDRSDETNALQQELTAMESTLQQELATMESTRQQELATLESALQQELTAMDSALQQELTAMDSALQSLRERTASRDGEQTSSLNTLQGQQQNQMRRLDALETTLAQLRARQNDNEAEQRRQFDLLRLQQRLDEINSLLRSGQRQLQLNGNQQAALQAYDMAVRMLRQTTDTTVSIAAAELSNIEQQLISERAEIASITAPDLDSIIAELNGLADAASNWPLQTQSETDSTDHDKPAADSNNDSGAWQQLQQQLGHLVTVRKTDQPQLSIDEQSKLKHHLQLQWRTAALLALQGREDAWHNTLDSIDAFIEQWFAADNRGVAAARQRLSELKQIQLQPDWPAPVQAMQALDKLQSSLTAQRQ